MGCAYRFKVVMASGSGRTSWRSNAAEKTKGFFCRWLDWMGDWGS
jgi:hypothetical protein